MADSTAQESSSRAYTTKQFGDACEMLVAAELTLAGIPALKVPDNWPHYDVIAQPPGGEPQLISVKARSYKAGANFVNYPRSGHFHWLAAVILRGSVEREFYLIPRVVFEERAKTSGADTKLIETYCRIDQLASLFPEYLGNFTLRHDGNFQE